MIYRFIMLSDEVENFRREFMLDADTSFLELHNTILKSVGYKTGEMASFFICDRDWTKEAEITLVEMNTSSEVDSIIMADTLLSDYLEDERQKLMFVFDYLSKRAFYMELREIIFGENSDKPKISKSVGDAPEQFIVVEEEPVIVTPVIATIDDIDTEDLLEADDIVEEFYGDDDYNDDELDSDAFDDIDDEINVEDLEI